MTERAAVSPRQGEVWWADLGEPVGSEPGFRRPMVVVQSDALNRTRLGTVIVVPMTSQVKWAQAPGNVLLGPRSTGLPKPSVAQCALATAIARERFLEKAGALSRPTLDTVFDGIDIALGR